MTDDASELIEAVSGLKRKPGDTGDPAGSGRVNEVVDQIAAPIRRHIAATREQEA